jgi:hypothetical protein
MFLVWHSEISAIYIVCTLLGYLGGEIKNGIVSHDIQGATASAPSVPVAGV